jgi:hypothetical protein
VVVLKLHQLLTQLLLKLLLLTLLLQLLIQLLLLLTQLLLQLLLKPSNLFFIWQAIVEVVPFPRDDFFYFIDYQRFVILSPFSAPLKLPLQK